MMINYLTEQTSNQPVDKCEIAFKTTSSNGLNVPDLYILRKGEN